MWDQKKTEQIAGLEKTTGLGEKTYIAAGL